MDKQILDDYSQLVKLDLVINGMRSKYPYTMNEQAKYTQHELEIYQRNFCEDNKNDQDRTDGRKGGNHDSESGIYSGGVCEIALIDI